MTVRIERDAEATRIVEERRATKGLASRKAERMRMNDDDKPNQGGSKTESGSLGKRACRGSQIVNIPFGSTLSIAGIDGSH